MKTPVDMLDHWESVRPDEVFLRQPRGGRFQDFTWRQVKRQARQIAGALRGLGLEPGDRVGLLSQNCAEWFIADLALMLGGYVSVPIYPTAHARTIEYVLEHSEAKALFVGKLAPLDGNQAGVGEDLLRLALPYDTLPAQYAWHELLERSDPLEGYTNPDPQQIMTIVYTSGSTGLPKGVVHTFASISWAGQTLGRDLGATVRDRLVSYLPLAHITERTYIEMASIFAGASVSFVESRESFVDDVTLARPTLFLAVPRLWTVFRANILEKIGSGRLEVLLKLPMLRGWVKRKIRGELGLAHAHTLGCGSAPVAASLLEWYRRIGLNIVEAWGMSEICAYGTINHPFDPAKVGSAGRAGIGCEIKVSDQGELLFRSPGRMKEYYKQPEATAAAFTEDGFLRTGDLCRIDDDGYAYITGRVKDTFKTAKGKFVGPLTIESELSRETAIEQSCVIGSGLPQPVALLQLSERARAEPREQLRGALGATLDAVNRTLEPHERIDALVVVTEPWTVEDDVLTPTLKIKRHVLSERFAGRVAGIRGGQVRWQDEL